jgi:hypothetical protein
MGITTVMMSTTMKPASLMVGIAVEVLFIHIIAQNVYALKKEEEEEAAIRDGLLMGIVMISTTI